MLTLYHPFNPFDPNTYSFRDLTDSDKFLLLEQFNREQEHHLQNLQTSSRIYQRGTSEEVTLPLSTLSERVNRTAETVEREREPVREHKNSGKRKRKIKDKTSTLKKIKWTAKEDEVVKNANDWDTAHNLLLTMDTPKRTREACMWRWQKFHKGGNNTKWTEGDKVKVLLAPSWQSLMDEFPSRTKDAIQTLWKTLHNNGQKKQKIAKTSQHLSPLKKEMEPLNKGSSFKKWSPVDDKIFRQAKKWQDLKGKFNGRSDEAIRKKWTRLHHDPAEKVQKKAIELGLLPPPALLPSETETTLSSVCPTMPPAEVEVEVMEFGDVILRSDL